MIFEQLLTKWNNGIYRGSPVRFASAINYSKVTVSEWARGVSSPGESIRPRILSELNKKITPSLTMEQLMSCFPTRDQRASHSDLTGPELPVDFTEVIGIVSAETFKEPAEDAVRLDVIDYLYKRKSGRRTYALRISGSCMEPKASDGDYAVIEETHDVPDGALGVVCWNGECTLKRVYHKTDHLELRPDNPAYKILRPKLKDCRIIGIVKSFHRKA